MFPQLPDMEAEEVLVDTVHEVPSHYKVVLDRLNEQRQQEQFTDITLIVDGHHFKAHPLFGLLSTNRRSVYTEWNCCVKRSRSKPPSLLCVKEILEQPRVGVPSPTSQHRSAHELTGLKAAGNGKETATWFLLAGSRTIEPLHWEITRRLTTYTRRAGRLYH